MTQENPPHAPAQIPPEVTHEPLPPDNIPHDAAPPDAATPAPAQIPPEITHETPPGEPDAPIRPVASPRGAAAPSQREFAQENVAEPARGGGAGLAILALIGVLLVAGGLYFVWRQEQILAARPNPAIDAAQNVAAENATQAMQQRLSQFDQRISGLEARPALVPPPAPPPPVDLAPLEQRIAALEQHQAAAPPTPGVTPPDLAVAIAPLEQRIAALERRPPPPDAKPAIDAAIAPLDQRLATLERRPAPVIPDVAAALAPLAHKLDDLTGETSTAQAAGAEKLAALDKRVTQDEQDARSGAGRATRFAQIQAASTALEAGQPLGNIDGAPPAITRFALAKPPTEAALRLTFPQARRRAETASIPSTQGESIGQRMWQQAQRLVTIRRGDTVIVGAPASMILDRANALLDAGDLAGCVATLKSLDAAAAAAIADWRDQAQSLLDARAALATMARA